MKKRVEWIDIAKAVCILMMIIGHTVQFGSTLRNAIFSFHMPLFIILSGYTYNCEKAKANFIKQTIKDIKQLILPVIITSCINVAIQFFLGQEKNITVLFDLIYNKINALYWCSGVKVHGAPALGSLWFLVSLFGVRLISRIVLHFFSKNNAIYIFFILSLVGIYIGQRYELLLNLDVTLAMFFFFAVGIIYKEKHEWFDKKSTLIFFVALIFWTMCIDQRIYIELASRSYPSLYLCFLEALAGSFICVKLSEGVTEVKYLNKCFVWIGQRTLLILCIHHLDRFFKECWTNENLILASIYRIIFDIIVLLMIEGIIYCYRKLKVAVDK